MWSPLLFRISIQNCQIRIRRQLLASWYISSSKRSRRKKTTVSFYLIQKIIHAFFLIIILDSAILANKSVFVKNIHSFNILSEKNFFFYDGFPIKVPCLFVCNKENHIWKQGISFVSVFATFGLDHLVRLFGSCAKLLCSS